MRRYPASARSKTYQLKITKFKNGKPEEFLKMTKNPRTEISGTGTTSVEVRTNYLRTLLCVESLSEFYSLESQVVVTTKNRVNFIMEDLLRFPPQKFTFQVEAHDAPRNA